MTNLKPLLVSNNQEWETPDYIFDTLDKEFNFTVDLCASDTNHKCDKYYTKENSGLNANIDNEIVFCNPPYKELYKWVKKCSETKKIAVMLIPARTDTKAFHEFILNKAEIRFIKGRIKFKGAKNAAPFPSMIVIFNREVKCD